MKNFSFLISLIAFVLVGLIAQPVSAQMFNSVRGNGNVVNQNRNHSNFTAISVGGAYDVYLSQGDYRVTVEADENLLEHIKTEVSDGLLKISNKVNIRNAEKLNVHIRMPNLEGIKASGASDVVAETSFKVNLLHLSCSGSSDIKLGRLSAEKLKCHLSGASDIRIAEGEAEFLDLQLSGSSDFKGSDFQVSSCKASLSGSSDALIYVSESLSATCSGSSDIKCGGSPSARNVHTSGSADIIFY